MRTEISLALARFQTVDTSLTSSSERLAISNVQVQIARDCREKYAIRTKLPLNKMPDKRTLTVCCI
jgi:hypothetical protein